MKLRKKKSNNPFFKEREGGGEDGDTKNQYLWELLKKGTFSNPVGPTFMEQILSSCLRWEEGALPKKRVWSF